MTPNEVEAIAEVLRLSALDDSLRIAADDVELKTPEQVIPPPVKRSNSKGFSARSPPELPPSMINNNSGFFAAGNTTPSKKTSKHPLTPSKRLASPARSASTTRRFDTPTNRMLSPVRQQPSRTHSHSAATGTHASPAQKKRTNSQTFAGSRQAVRTLSPRSMARCDSVGVRRTIRTDSATRGKKLSRCPSKGTSERQPMTSSFDRPTRKSSVARQGSLFSHDKPKSSILKKDLKLPQGEVMESIKNATRALSRSATDSKLASPTFSRKASRREYPIRAAPHADILG